MPLADFLRIIYERQIRGSRRLKWLQRQWAKAERDGVQSDPLLRFATKKANTIHAQTARVYLRQLYEQKKEELEAKERERIGSDEVSSEKQSSVISPA